MDTWDTLKDFETTEAVDPLADLDKLVDMLIEQYGLKMDRDEISPQRTTAQTESMWP